jgi:hypothetical protein
MNIKEYIFPFILGGIGTVILKYIATFVSPSIAVIISTLPITLFSIYFLVDRDTAVKFIKGHILQSLFTTIVALIYFYGITLYPHLMVYFISVLIWVLLSYYFTYK